MESSNIMNFVAQFQAMFEADDLAAAAKHHENARVATVRGQFEALGRGDMAAFLDVVHPEVELEIAAPPELNWMSKARGIDDFGRVVQHNFSEVDEQDSRPVAIVAQGDVVVVIGRERGVIRRSGAAYDLYFTYQFTFREDKEWRILEIAGPAAP
jgi:ketosteroid isomerase-like protein